MILVPQLTHNVHGPHDQTFYNFLSRLQEEYYELKRTGYAGEGFFTQGRRLGAGIPQTTPALIAQQRSIELEIAARRRTNTVPGTNGPVRLGGGNLATLGLTPRELAVLVRRGNRSPRDMIISLSLSTKAADMRAADEKKCASGTRAQQEADKAARDSHHSNAFDLTDDFNFSEDLIILDDDLSGSTSPSASRPADPQPSSHRKQPLRSQSAVTQRAQPSVNVLTKPRPPPVNNTSKPLAVSPWTCPTCTLINQPTAVQCDACQAMRPPQPDAQVTRPAAPAGWTCGVCSEEGMEHNLWICRFCGSVKTESTFG